MIKLGKEFKGQWGIYVIINLVNNKKYYGSSVNLHRRLYEHRRLLLAGKHENKHLQHSFNTYGEDGFKVDVVQVISNITELELRDIETKYIQDEETYKPNNGYNNCSVGNGTSHLEMTQERKDKISAANKGKIPHNKGVAMPEEQKELLKQIKRKSKGKAILVFTQTGEFIGETNSIAETVELYKCSKDAIISVCKGRTGTHKGYIFKYKDSNEATEEKEYKKNITCGQFVYIVSKGTEEYKFKYIKEVIKFFTGKEGRNGNLERKLRPCKDGEIVEHNNYEIEFKNALNDSDVVDAMRQP